MLERPPAPDRSEEATRRPSEREAAVAREILRIACDDLKLEGEPPAADEPLGAKLDSLALLGLVVAVEDRFRIVLTDEDAAEARSLADLARIVAARAAPEQLPVSGDAP